MKIIENDMNSKIYKIHYSRLSKTISTDTYQRQSTSNSLFSYTIRSFFGLGSLGNYK